jgi:hypothetical protein
VDRGSLANVELGVAAPVGIVRVRGSRERQEKGRMQRRGVVQETEEGGRG